MTAFATAYLIVWGTLTLYLVRLGQRQRRVRRALHELDGSSSSAKARSDKPTVATIKFTDKDLRQCG
jgi:CcmD family protein